MGGGWEGIDRYHDPTSVRPEPVRTNRYLGNDNLNPHVLCMFQDSRFILQESPQIIRATVVTMGHTLA